MTERISKKYAVLFEIRLLHHFWLDEGATVFDLISSQEERDRRLLAYDMRKFFALEPTATTVATLDGLRGVHKSTTLGCIVAVPEGTVVPDDTAFEFALSVRNQALLNYTALTLPATKIYEIYYQPEKRTYRYKENVPVLSNLTGASRGAGAGKTLFLSREFPTLAATDTVESLVVVGNALMQLTSDQPGANTQQLGAPATSLPVFVHQGDVPAIVPPVGLVGAPARGILLADDIPDQVFSLIRIAAVRASDGDFSCIDGAGHPKAPHPVFQARFKNRSTFRQFFDKNSGATLSASATALPLTHFGNADTRQKPSEGLVKPQRSGVRITQLISEIFV